MENDKGRRVRVQVSDRWTLVGEAARKAVESLELYEAEIRLMGLTPAKVTELANRLKTPPKAPDVEAVPVPPKQRRYLPPEEE